MKSRNERRINRHLRSKIRGTESVPRVVLYRSNKHFEVQVIDDVNQRTLLSYNSKKLLNENDKKNSNNRDNVKIVAQKIIDLCKENKIKKLIFDKSGYHFTGRVKCIADALRDAGLLGG